MINHTELNRNRIETKNDILELLKTNQRVCVVRPCSWGKSHLIAELCQELLGKKIIFEPTNILEDYIQRYDGVNDKNVTIDTYQNLLHKTKSNFRKMYGDVKYIFLDEVHRVGAKEWGEAIRLLCDTFFNAKVIGMSATPIRSDGNDIIDSIFNGIQVTPLYLGEAIMRGMLPNVKYVAALYTITEERRRALEKINKSKCIGKEEKSLLTDELNDALLQYEKLNNIPNILQKYLFKDAFHLHHMKFIVFCNKVKEIDEVKILTKSWFEQCYKETGIKKNINLYDVHCYKNKQENIEEVKKFEKEKKENDIDIMVSVNMFNEGLHLNGVTGVILLRKTTSNIVYFQQIGRVINQENEIPIVFDFVNNHNSVGTGYIKLFQDYLFESGTSKKNRYKYKYNANGNLLTENGDILQTKNGEIINIHDEVKEMTIIIDKIIDKTRGNPMIRQLLDKHFEWLKENSKYLTLTEISNKLNINKVYIRIYLNFCKLSYKKETYMSDQKKFMKSMIELKETLYNKNIKEIWDIMMEKYPTMYKKISVRRFKKILKENNIKYIDLPENLSNEEKKEIQYLLLTNKYYPDSITKALCRENKSLVNNYIEEIRIDIINKNREKSLKEIAKEINVGESMVRVFCMRHNIDIPALHSKKTENPRSIISLAPHIVMEINKKLQKNICIEDVAQKMHLDLKVIIDFCLAHYIPFNFKDKKIEKKYKPSFNTRNYKNAMKLINDISPDEKYTLNDILKILKEKYDYCRRIHNIFTC